MPLNIDPANSGELSPLKRALVEIRRLRAQLEESEAARREPIAIVGMALRLPGGVTTPERFWQALADGEDLIGPVPPDRWEASEYLHADPDHPGAMYDAHGGFLADVDMFDAEFFGINPREAASMDPQQRLLLELTWEALERAAIDPKTLANTPAGVYLGISGSDYGRQLTRDVREIEAYSAVGGALSIAAGRISYFLALRGPSLVVDTACSSSLVAVQLAAESLRRGETNLAIVGGSNLILSPDFNISFARTRMLSRDGRSKSFDAAADGYVRGEGCCVLVLKRLADAVGDGDRVLASIAGLAVNQDGRSAGITAPNGPAQEAVIRAALKNAGLEPAAVSYVEAHGTGTPLGDPIEAQALGAVYGMARGSDRILRIGSVKTNLGHTEAVAGLVGLIKVVLMMQPGHGIAPNLHFKNPNPKIDFARLRIAAPTQLTPWPQDEWPLYAGVSSFGFSGTNAHLIVVSGRASGSAAAPGPERADEPESKPESLLALSAANPKALRELAERYVPFLEETRERFEDICFTAIEGRTGFAHRLALRARSPQAAAAMLSKWLRGEAAEGLATGFVDPVEREGEPLRMEGDALAQWQAGYLRGDDLRGKIFGSGAQPRRVELPVYPFARARFWFGPAPQEKRAQERERMWRAAVAEAQRQSLQGPLGWKLDGFAERLAALERLTLAHARNVLADADLFQCPMSLEEAMQQAGFRPIYRNLVGRWLSGLAAANVLEEEGGKFSAVVPLTPVSLEPYWRDAERLLEDDPGTLAYVKQCGPLLADVLTGRTSALETLFPQGSFELAEGLSRSSTGARYLDEIVSAAVASVARALGQRRNVRILEIGFTTGAITSAILAHLPAGQVDYRLTAVSEFFLARAREKFSAYSFMQYAIFDLDRPLEDRPLEDRPLEEQGMGGGKFDAIVAGNGVHASRDIAQALARVRRLLAPGALLALHEPTRHQAWFDMTIGLVEPWQPSQNGDRPEHPLLNPQEWRDILARNGFSEAVALPREDSPASRLGRHVVLARCSPEELNQDELNQDELNQGATRVLPDGVAECNGNTVVEPVSEPRIGSVIGPVIGPRIEPGIEWGEIPESNLAARLQALSSQEREQAMLEFVRATIRFVFKLNIRAEELGVRDRLSDLGMDSLIALELRSKLAKSLGPAAKNLSSTIAFDTGTVGELSHALVLLIESPAGGLEGLAVPDVPGVPGVPVNGGSGRFVASAAAPARSAHARMQGTQRNQRSQWSRHAQVTAEQLSEMSEEEVERLLNERLSSPSC